MSHKPMCKCCLYYDSCTDRGVSDCDFFESVYPGEVADNLIEIGRSDFLEDWVEYINDRQIYDE